MEDVQAKTEARRQEYNESPPHTALGEVLPVESAGWAATGTGPSASKKAGNLTSGLGQERGPSNGWKSHSLAGTEMGGRVIHPKDSTSACQSFFGLARYSRSTVSRLLYIFSYVYYSRQRVEDSDAGACKIQGCGIMRGAAVSDKLGGL